MVLLAEIISVRDAFIILEVLKMSMDATKLLRYSIQLSMLKQLLNKKLISPEEYNHILKKLMRDYEVVSNIVT